MEMRYTIRYLAKNDDNTHSIFEVKGALSVQCYVDGSEVFNSESANIRPEVMKFAEAMERKLKLNEYKVGWKGMDGRAWWTMSPEDLMTRVEEELEEVKSCESDSELLGEAADVSNFLMMLCDVKGLL
jgi:hypothetical protein